jgi:hypothetical protein
MLPENIDTETYHFSYFYKYMCLYLKKVELDTVAAECLNPPDTYRMWEYMEPSYL